MVSETTVRIAFKDIVKNIQMKQHVYSCEITHKYHYIIFKSSEVKTCV